MKKINLTVYLDDAEPTEDIVDAIEIMCAKCRITNKIISLHQWPESKHESRET